MKYIISESQYKKLISEDTDSWDDMDLEDRIQEIRRRKEYVEKLLPKILKYFKIKYKDELLKIDVESTFVKFGEENLLLDIPRLEFYFNQSLINRAQDIKNDLKDVFDIDLNRYGYPLGIRVYEQTWKRVYG
jgi:phage pi2 protein 07